MLRRAAPTCPICDDTLMIEPVRLAASMRFTTACAAKKAARTLRPNTTSKSSTETSSKPLGRLVPALLTKMSKGSAASIAAAKPARSVTSTASASALPPLARIALAASPISPDERAASVTLAPASAKACAAASPMPRPAPVTSARLPSSRNEGSRPDAGIAIGLLGRGRVGDVAAAVAAHADIGLLGMAGKTLEHAKARAVLAYHRRGLVRQHLLVGDGLEELADPEPTRVARRLLGRQRVVRADDLVAKG